MRPDVAIRIFLEIQIELKLTMYSNNSFIYAGKLVLQYVWWRIVNFLIFGSPYEHKSRNFSCDHFTTFRPLENLCLERNIIMVKTIMTNMKGVGLIKFLGSNENMSTNIYWEKNDGNVSVKSYVAITKSTGKLNIHVLSTI